MICWKSCVSIHLNKKPPLEPNNHKNSLLCTAHEIQEIRVRALHDIENKLKRGLWEEQDIKFRATSVMKALIRWFGHVPICEETTVLELISLLLNVSFLTISVCNQPPSAEFACIL